jgi:hypothetical protein
MKMENTKIKITPELIKQSKTLTCDCGGMLFQNGIVYKKLSALISPTGNEEMLPLEVLICTKCGKVPNELNVGKVLPEEVLAQKSKISMLGDNPIIKK